jgi:hypothetical protein
MLISLLNISLRDTITAFMKNWVPLLICLSLALRAGAYVLPVIDSANLEFADAQLTRGKAGSRCVSTSTQ